MNGTWIQYRGKTDNAVYFRRSFTMETSLTDARVRLSALGIYKAYLNGRELDEQVFLPGRTSYQHRVQAQEYDVSKLLIPGKNILAVRLMKGWYKKTPALYCEIAMGNPDGNRAEASGISGWKVSAGGPLGFHDMKLGEIYDARKESDWTAPDFDDSGWETPGAFIYTGRIIPHEGEQILEHERFCAHVLHTPDGAAVLDFGQNIAGYMEFTVTGRGGETVRMVYGETLDENGNFTQNNLSFAKSKKTGNFPQTIQYTMKEGRQTYKPQASIHGFRYVKLEGWPEKVKAENFTAIAVYSDLKPVGSFSCSNEKVNKLVSNIRWSTKGNFLDIPTDCPQRERAGWTGDIMVYSVPATYQMDTRRFLKKWLKDVILEQGKDGRICNIVPDGGMPSFMDGAAGWSDAIVKLPWVLYQFYGDKDILETAYPAMQKHVAFMEQRSAKRKPWNLMKGKHWDDLIDTGFHWGEWLEPGGSMPAGALRGFTCPDVEVASAYYAWSAGKLAQIAGILGKAEDAKHYAALHEKVRKAYCKEFLPDGLVHSDRQCRYVRPVALELADPQNIKAIAASLNEAVIKNHYHIGTGFLSTPHICNVLSDNGFADTAYRLLENEEQPGWLYEVNRGATTMWENWYGLNESGKPKNSLNHYSPGAIIGWLYSRCAGIQPLAPGFEKILIAPVVGGSFRYVNCSYESVAGLIRSDWKIEGRQFSLSVDVPRPAEIRLPDGTIKTVEAGKYQFMCELS